MGGGEGGSGVSSEGLWVIGSGAKNSALKATVLGKDEDEVANGLEPGVLLGRF